MTGSGSISSSHAPLLKLVHEVSQDCLAALSQGLAIQNEPLLEHREVLGHWMSLILISGEDLRITFQAHFMFHHVQIFAAAVHGTKSSPVSLSLAQDFMKEYCNFVAGKLKNTLMNSNISVGTSLPLLTRGFDEIFFIFDSAFPTCNDRWKLKSGEAEIICSVQIETYNEVQLKVQAEESGGSGAVDFL